MVDFFPWEEKYSLEIDSIDSQHKELVALLNELFLAMENGKGATVTSSILDRLALYAVKHFSYEEKLFEQYSYPDSIEHHKAHEALISKVTDLTDKKFVTIELAQFLKDWLIVHIMGDDKKYTSFLIEKGVQ